MFTNNRHTRGARAAVIYVTLGALIVVWSGIWCVNLLNDPTRGDNALSWCYGLLLTGATFVLIGLAIGWIGRSGRSGRSTAGSHEVATSGAPAEEPVATRGPAGSTTNRTVATQIRRDAGTQVVADEESLY